MEQILYGMLFWNTDKQGQWWLPNLMDCLFYKRLHAFWLIWSVIHKAVAMNEWRGRILLEIDMSCPHCGSSLVESLEHIFFICSLAQHNWHCAANVIWKLFAIRGDLDPHKSFSMMQCIFYRPLSKTLKSLSRIWFFHEKWSSGLFGVIGLIWSSMACGEDTSNCVGLLGWLCGNVPFRTWENSRHCLWRCS